MPKRGDRPKTKGANREEPLAKLSRCEDGVAFVQLDRPPANILNLSALRDLDEAVKKALSDSDVKVVVIASKSETAFVGGPDIEELLSLEDSAAAREFAEAGQKVLRGIEQAPKPIMAAISGLCLSVGLELAMACHMRVAASDALFGFPEIKLSLMPYWGGAHRLSRLVGSAKALELILTGRVVDAQEAHRLGLVNRLVAPGQALAEAAAMAKEIASHESMAITITMRAVERSNRLILSRLEGKDAEDFAALMASEAARRAIRSAQAMSRADATGENETKKD